MGSALIIFARQPVPGQVKTRLARDVGHDVATEAYRAMLADTLEVAAGVGAARRMIFWGGEGGGPADDFDGCGFEHFIQAGTGLGARMSGAFARAFEAGARHCCIMGSDSPSLPPEFIRQAFALLERDEADVVFGPCDDGGYYLLGLSSPQPQLFDDIAWSTPLVLAASMRRARVSGLRIALLPGWYDVDTLADLRRLATAGDGGATATRKVAMKIFAGCLEKAGADLK